MNDLINRKEVINLLCNLHIDNIAVNDKRVTDYIRELPCAEESELFVKLPIKVGDTVYTNCCMSGWYFRAKDAPYKAKVVFIGLNNSEETGGGLFNVEFERGYMLQFNFSDLGRTVFLTKEEAEFTLKGDLYNGN